MNWFKNLNLFQDELWSLQFINNLGGFDSWLYRTFVFNLGKDLFFPNHTKSITEARMTTYIKGNGRTNEHYLL